MTTNRDWLFSLPLEEQYAWMNAEHQERALDGDTAALNAKIAELERKLRISWEYECKFQTERDEWKLCWEQCKAQSDAILAERDKLQEQVFTLKVECDDLTSTCDDLENELHKAKAERERYREKFGKCLDYADAIHALMDEGMA